MRKDPKEKAMDLLDELSNLNCQIGRVLADQKGKHFATHEYRLLLKREIKLHKKQLEILNKYARCIERAQ